MKLRILIWGAAILVAAGCGGGDSPQGPACTTPATSPPDVSGTWVLSSPEIAASTCAAEINQILEGVIADSPDPCDVEVAQSGNAVSLVDCDGNAISGCVDGDGTIRAPESASTTQQGCTVSIDQILVADSSSADSAAQFAMTIGISGNCRITGTCSATINANWDRAAGSALRQDESRYFTLSHLVSAIAGQL